MKYIATKKVSQEKLIAELASGSRCLALIKDKAIISYLWYDIRTIKYYGIRRLLGKGEVYFYSAETRPDMRGQGYASTLRSKAYELLGANTYYSITDVNNESALRFKSRIGAELIESFTYIKLWKYSKLFKKEFKRKYVKDEEPCKKGNEAGCCTGQICEKSHNRDLC
jgi:GNAT superfamily N-acetyltransferase